MTNDKENIVVELNWWKVAFFCLALSTWTLFVGTMTLAVSWWFQNKSQNFVITNYYAGDDGFVPSMGAENVMFKDLANESQKSMPKKQGRVR